MGTATAAWVTGSIEGVTSAARTNAPMMAQRHMRSSRLAVTSPNAPSPMRKSGISKITPVQSMNRVSMST